MLRGAQEWVEKNLRRAASEQLVPQYNTLTYPHRYHSLSRKCCWGTTFDLAPSLFCALEIRLFEYYRMECLLHVDPLKATPCPVPVEQQWLG